MVYLRINMEKKDSFLVKERLNFFFEKLNQNNADVPDQVFQDLGFEIEKFNLGKVNARTTIKKIDDLLKSVIGEELCLSA